ncbi:MAG TPA: hypothetical protein PKM84_01925 [Candidatus Pacearchaeota archaeon]|nr:hypothetical protein [Candidatus Pacearchaeota archaeon]
MSGNNNDGETFNWKRCGVKPGEFPLQEPEILTKAFTNEAGGKKICEIINWPHYSVIFPLTAGRDAKEMQVIVMQRHMSGVEKIMSCLPAMSFRSCHITPADAAIQALFDRTGYAAKEMMEIGKIYPDPEHSERRCYVFMAEGCYAEPNKKPSYVTWMSLEKWLEEIKHGRVRDMASISATYLALSKLKFPTLKKASDI